MRSCHAVPVIKPQLLSNQKQCALLGCFRYMEVVKALQSKELEAALQILELSPEEQVLFARQLCLVARYAFIN